MPIDVHAHYVPRRILDRLEARAHDFGISVVEHPPGCQCFKYEYGLQLRPFFPRLLEDIGARKASMERQGIDRQVLSTWADIFGYGLEPAKGERWHRVLNECMSELCAQHPRHFSWMASGHLPDAARAARELERAVRELGAVGGVIAANVEGTNLGELPLDEYWAAAEVLEVPIFIHPVQPMPTSRSRKFALNQIVQYTFDTTLSVGSLISSGVLDRYPALRLILSHGGGALPYLIGRFDCMHARMDASQGNVAKEPPSRYLDRMFYDTIVHDAQTLRYLASRVQIERIVLGSDDSFPPADLDPLRTVIAAGFSTSEIARITEQNPRKLFKLPRT